MKMSVKEERPEFSEETDNYGEQGKCSFVHLLSFPKSVMMQTNVWLLNQPRETFQVCKNGAEIPRGNDSLLAFLSPV